MAQATKRGVVYGVYHGSEGSDISVAPCGMLKTTNGRNGAKTNSQRRNFMGSRRHSGKAWRSKDVALSPNALADQRRLDASPGVRCIFVLSVDPAQSKF